MIVRAKMKGARTMKVVEFKTVDGRTRYYLANATGQPVEPVLKYLRFKDNAGYARNTLRSQCIHLKHFFTYLEELKKQYEDVSLDDLAGLIAWLKNPDINKRVIPLRLESMHKERVINANVDTVISFYDYMMRREGLENHLSERLVKFFNNSNKNRRSFLYGLCASPKGEKPYIEAPGTQTDY